MGCESTVLTEMERAGFRASTKLVFLFLREAVRCHEDQRLAVSRGWLAAETGYSDKVGRSALQQLEKAGWVSVQRTKGKFNFVRVLYRVEGQVQGQVKGQVYIDGKYEEKGQVQGQVKGHTGVSVGVEVSPGVGKAVVSPVSEEVLQRENAAQNGAPPAPAKAKKKRGDPPYFRSLTDHISVTYANVKGCKYPFQVWEINKLRDLSWQFSSAHLMAWWDGVFLNDWCKKSGLSIRAFVNDLPKLQDDRSASQRALGYEKKLANEGEPPSRDELRKKLEDGRNFAANLVAKMAGGPKIAGFARVGGDPF